MNKILFLLVLLFFPFYKGFSQDSVSYSGNTKLVLDHFSGLFPNQKKVINLSSYFDDKNVYFYNISIVEDLVLAINPQPLYYNKYKSLILIFQNYYYVAEHSKDYILKYINDIKDFVNINVVIDEYKPLRYHLRSVDEEILVHAQITYFCYKVKNGKIISFEKSIEKYKNPTISFNSIK